jgi:hypothetical protein
MTSPHYLCLSVYRPYQVLNAWTSLDETWYVYHDGNWAHLNGVLCKSLPSVFVSVYVSPSNFARQRHVKHVPEAHPSLLSNG